MLRMILISIDHVGFKGIVFVVGRWGCEKFCNNPTGCSGIESVVGRWGVEGCGCLNNPTVYVGIVFVVGRWGCGCLNNPTGCSGIESVVWVLLLLWF